MTNADMNSVKSTQKTILPPIDHGARKPLDVRGKQQTLLPPVSGGQQRSPPGPSTYLHASLPPICEPSQKTSHQHATKQHEGLQVSKTCPQETSHPNEKQRGNFASSVNRSGMSPEDALRYFKSCVTEYEQKEIQEYKELWYLGKKENKIHSSNVPEDQDVKSFDSDYDSKDGLYQANNVLLYKKDGEMRTVVTDFGVSYSVDDRDHLLGHTLCYMSPELLLGKKCGPAIDMWSLGCMLAELHFGHNLFRGPDVGKQFKAIMDVLGAPPKELLAEPSRRDDLFGVTLKSNQIPQPRTTLAKVLNSKNAYFVDFIERCLQYDPKKRMTPEEIHVPVPSSNQKPVLRLPPFQQAKKRFSIELPSFLFPIMSSVDLGVVACSEEEETFVSLKSC
uniref:dual-specificity kinase n=1 Tax=Scophthalmus maximus TaxID=52904 RepID=A0A8D3CW74_SCOMX